MLKLSCDKGKKGVLYKKQFGGGGYPQSYQDKYSSIVNNSAQVPNQGQETIEQATPMWKS